MENLSEVDIMTRTPLAQRTLPDYSRRQEWSNMISHIIGAAIGVGVLFIVIFHSEHRDVLSPLSGLIYAVSLIALYTVSSVYHGLRPSMGKKVMQVIDHCTIYFLIAGSYTPILISAMRPAYPTLAWIIFAAEWSLAAFAVVFTAIDHKKYGKLSMACYIGMGWFIILALKPTLEVIGKSGFLLLLLGGISYTIGAVIYGLGKKRPVLHTVFHYFVLLGSILQAAAILIYAL